LDPFTFLSWPPFHWPQSIDLLAGIMLDGHDAATARIAAITIPVNAIIYGLAIFWVTRVIARWRHSPGHIALASLGLRGL
jgi:hypothetical protein